MGKKLLILLSFSFVCNLSIAQSTAGRDFWVAFLDAQLYCFSRDTLPRTPPPPFVPGPWDEDTLELYITSQYPAKVKVTANNKDNVNFSTSITLVPNVTSYVKIPPHMSCRNFMSDQVTNFGVHITSDSQINVQAVNRFWSTKGATVVLPTEAIPDAPEYFITTNASPNQWTCNFVDFKGGKINKSPEFVVVGIADTSYVEIQPSGISSWYDNKRNMPFSVTLLKGQTFHYMTTDDDLTGSVVRARTLRSKFAVFAGNRQTYSDIKDSVNLPCSSGFPYSVYGKNKLDDLAFVDHTYEQMFPTVTLGTSYVAAPLYDNFGGYYIKILAIEEDTKVSIDGKLYKTLNQSQFFTYNMGFDSMTVVTANKKISVTQFAKGPVCNKHSSPKITMGDLSQTQLVPDQQMGFETNINNVTRVPNNAWVNSSPNFSPENYLKLVTQIKDTGFIKVNGKPVPQYVWRRSLVFKNYAYANLPPIGGVNYHIKSAKGFIAYVYGYGNFEGYGYVGGANFKKRYNNFVVNALCKKDTLAFTRVPADSFSNFSWDFGDGSAVKTGANVKKIYKDSGWYLVKMYSQHIKTGALDSVTKRLYVASADETPVLIKDTVVCGLLDFTLFSKNFSFQKQYVWQDQSTLYYRNFKKPGLFWEKITERSGCSYTDTLIIKNYPFPVAKFSATDSVFCSNGTKEIVFTNQSTSKDTIQNVNWDFGDKSIDDTSKYVKHLYKKANLYLVVLRVTTIHGCDDVAAQLVEIKPAPLAQFTVTDVDTCYRTNHLMFNNTTVIDSAYYLKYKWDFGQGPIISGRTPRSPRVYVNPGKYTVKLMYEYNNGCTDTLEKSFTIYNHPTALFTPVAKGNCLQDSVKFTNQSTGPNTPLTWRWSFGDASFDTLQKQPTHQFKKKGAYEVQLVAVSPQGCTDTSRLTYKINGAPTALFLVNDSAQCVGSNNFKLKSVSISDTGALKNMQWRFSDGVKALNTDSTNKTFANAGVYTITLKVANALGCIDSVNRTVLVKKLPLVQFNTLPYASCFDAQNFNFTYVPNQGNDSIVKRSWYYNKDSLFNANQIQNYQFAIAGAYPIQLKLTSIDGCENTITKKVFVHPEPQASLSLKDSIQCFTGHAFNIVNLSSIVGGQLKTHTWNYGDATTSNLQQPAVKKYLAAGNYLIQYKVVSDSGCMDTASRYVRLSTSPKVSPPSITGACLGDTVNYKANATITTGTIAGYRWQFGDGQTSVNATTQHIYQSAGNYKVMVSAYTAANCSDSAFVFFKVIQKPKADFVFVHFNKDNAGIRFLFLDRSENATNWNWKFGSVGASILQDPEYIFNDTGKVKVRLIASNQNSCFDTTEQVIPVLDKINIFFPNAFTPNGNGINDGFGLNANQFEYVKGYRLQVFNRWGEKLFDSENKEERWLSPDDPNILQGVYIWVAKIKDIYNVVHDMSGRVEVIR
jgi:gliding motility-associated-like protein